MSRARVSGGYNRVPVINNKRVRKTRNPKKCFMCGKEFWGHWNKIYCGNSTTGKKKFGCAYVRDRISTNRSNKKWTVSERGKEWLKKYNKTENRKISWRRAKAKYYSLNREEINNKRRKVKS